MAKQGTGTIIDRKNVSPCNHVDIGALRLPTVTVEKYEGKIGVVD